VLRLSLSLSLRFGVALAEGGEGLVGVGVFWCLGLGRDVCVEDLGLDDEGVVCLFLGLLLALEDCELHSELAVFLR